MMAKPTMGLLVPAYFGPQYANTAPYWTQLSQAAATLHNSLIVVANPYNGPGPAAPIRDAGGDPVRKKLTPVGQPVPGTGDSGNGFYWQKYADAIADVRGSNARVLGYVRTDIGTIPTNDVQRDINTWLAWYRNYPGAPGIDGIFFDEVATQASLIAYYQGLYQYVQNHLPGALVVNNFGAFPDLGYYNIGSSLLCIKEETFAEVQHWANSFDPFGPSYRLTCEQLKRSVLLAHKTLPTEYLDVLSLALGQYLGWVYATDDAMPNPWDTLPPYFDAMVQEVEQNFPNRRFRFYLSCRTMRAFRIPISIMQWFIRRLFG